MHKSWICCSLLVLFAPPALASTLYPTILQQELELEQAPACQLCHTTSRGGPNTARKPFAQTLVARGLTGGANVTTLSSLVHELGDADSDADGVTDVEELQQGSDPNDAESMPEEPNTAPPRVDAATSPSTATDAGEAPKMDAAVGQPHQPDAGRDAAVEASSSAAPSTDNETRTHAHSPEEREADAPKSGSCSVSAANGRSTSGWLLGLAALSIACALRARMRDGVSPYPTPASRNSRSAM